MTKSQQWMNQQLYACYLQALRQDFSVFTHQSFHTLNAPAALAPNWHIDIIAEYLDAVQQQQVKRLIINMPPRYLKSQLISVAWPAWLLAQAPYQRIIVASYAQSLSLKHSLDCRNLMRAGWYRYLFPQTQIQPGQNEKHKFVTTTHGFRLAVSVGGALTGEGGDILIVDDPLNPKQAESALYRNNANRWFEHTFMSRLNDKRKGAIIIVMQRLHTDDLSGFLLEKGGWEHLNIAAQAMDTRYYFVGATVHRRNEGEAIHPTREDARMLQRLKHQMGSHAYNAQYQQAPLQQDGNYVKLEWFGRYRDEKTNAQQQHDLIVQSWDTAIKTGSANDPSVCMTLSIAGDGIRVRDIFREKLEYLELRRQIILQAQRWQPQAVLIEDKASGQSLLQDLRQSSQLPLLGVLPKQDKLTRFMQITPLIEAGRVHLPHQAAWLAEFERELCAFPHGRHDDQVDALSQALQWLHMREVSGKAQMRRF